MSRLQPYATLGLSLLVFVAALSASLMGTRHDSLYVQPGRIDAAPAFTTPEMIRR
jgi:hypothetical protein